MAAETGADGVASAFAENDGKFAGVGLGHDDAATPKVLFSSDKSSRSVRVHAASHSGTTSSNTFGPHMNGMSP